MFMHQPIPVMPIPPPPGNSGGFAHVVSPGDGAFAILSRLRGLGISIPRGDPRAFDTCVTDWLVHQGLEKPVDIFEGMF